MATGDYLGESPALNTFNISVGNNVEAYTPEGNPTLNRFLQITPVTENLHQHLFRSAAIKNQKIDNKSVVYKIVREK